LRFFDLSEREIRFAENLAIGSLKSKRSRSHLTHSIPSKCGLGYVANTVIEAPIGWLQMATTVGVSRSSRPNFATALGVVTPDNTMQWTCLGRSQFATMLPDNDGTWNTGGISNPALCIADYLQTQKNEFGLGASLTLDSLDTVVAAANVLRPRGSA
jgi:hypothetical protein